MDFFRRKNSDKIPFKFPELKPNEIRSNILYYGLCVSFIQFDKNLKNNTKYPLTSGHGVIVEISTIGSEVKNFLKKVI